jgi:hypothetical protein
MDGYSISGRMSGMLRVGSIIRFQAVLKNWRKFAIIQEVANGMGRNREPFTDSFKKGVAL